MNPITFQDVVAEHPAAVCLSISKHFEPVDSDMERQLEDFIPQGLLTKHVETTSVVLFSEHGKETTEEQDVTWNMTEKGQKLAFQVIFSLLTPVTQSVLMALPSCYKNHSKPIGVKKHIAKRYDGPLVTSQAMGEKLKNVSQAFKELQEKKLFEKTTRYNQTFYKFTWSGRNFMEVVFPGVNV